jgi:hypothetical protein
MKDAGEELLRDLAAANFPIEAAFWMYFSESDEWRLVLASNRVNQDGPRAAYAEIQRLLRSKPSTIRLADISLRDPGDQLVEAIRRVKWAEAASAIRLTGSTMSGVYIDDAYIYRLRPSAAAR